MKRRRNGGLTTQSGTVTISNSIVILDTKSRDINMTMGKPLDLLANLTAENKSALIAAIVKLLPATMPNSNEHPSKFAPKE